MKHRRGQADLTVREATSDDAAAISALIFGLADFVVDTSQKEKAAVFFNTLTIDATRSRLESSQFQYFVCVSNDKILGVIALKDEAHVYHLFVDHELHGQGVARLLWDYVRAKTHVGVITVNSSPFAVSVYEKFGFVQTDEMQYQDGIEFMPMEYSNR